MGGVDMATAATGPISGISVSRLRLAAGLMTLAGVGFVGYAVMFFVRNFTDAFLEVGIGPAQVSVGKKEIEAFSPSLYDYISHLHIAVSGFIAATGIAVAALAWYGVKRGHLWAWVTAVVAPVVGLAVALPAHYPYGFDTLDHLGLIYLATGVFAVGALLALPQVLRSRSENLA